MNLQSALALHASGNLAGAEQAYRKFLQESKTDQTAQVAFEKLGLICLGTGRVDEGRQLISSALELNPNNPDLYLNLAVAQKTQGRLEEAILSNRKALQLGAKYPEAHLNLGDVLNEHGQPDEAIKSYKKAIELRPRYAEAHNNLGVALLNQGKLDEATRWLQKSVELKPDYVQAQHNLGMVLQKQGLFERAIQPCKVAVKLFPNPDSFLNLGNALFSLYCSTGKSNLLAEAIAAFEKVAQLKPDAMEAYNNLGLAFREQRSLDDAIKSFQKAIAITSDYAEVHHNLGLTFELQHNFKDASDCFERTLKLHSRKFANDSPVEKIGRLLLEMRKVPAVYGQFSEIEIARNSFEGSLREALSLVSEMKRPFELPEIEALRRILFITDTFYLSYQGLDDKLLISEYGNLVKAILKQEISPFLEPAFIQADQARKKIRLGIASEFLGKHHGSYWAYGWLANLPKDDYEFYLYSLNGRVDKVTNKFASLGTFRWLPFREHNYLTSLNTIKDDKLDVLIITDVGMTASTKILSLLRVAPIQCAGWAHPVTTGSQNIDYFLSNEFMETAESDDHYSENLVRLPKIGLNLDYPDDSDVAAARGDFDLPAGKILYGSVQSIFKYLPQFDSVYPAIAQRVNDAFFVFLSSDDANATEIFRQRLKLCFEQTGLNFEERVKILPRLSPRGFMQILTLLDVNLDSIEWNGGFTTMRALAMNCPTVTLPGKFMRGRHGISILKMIDVEELVAESLDDYVLLACKLGLDEQFRKGVVSKIAAHKGRLFNDCECVQYLDHFLKTKVSETNLQPGVAAK